MGGGPAVRGPRSTAKFLLRYLNVQKRSSTFLGKKSAPSVKILATRMRKGPPPYVSMPPRMVNPALRVVLCRAEVGERLDGCLYTIATAVKMRRRHHLQSTEWLCVCVFQQGEVDEAFKAITTTEIARDELRDKSQAHNDDDDNKA